MGLLRTVILVQVARNILTLRAAFHILHSLGDYTDTNKCCWSFRRGSGALKIAISLVYLVSFLLLLVLNYLVTIVNIALVFEISRNKHFRAAIVLVDRGSFAHKRNSDG